MQFLILLLHVLLCVSLVALIMVQNGKGADLGAAFGAGASQTVFGSSGASSFLLKLTGGLGALFFLTSIYLGHFDAAAAQKTALPTPVSNTRSIVIPGQKTTPQKKVNSESGSSSTSSGSMPSSTTK